MKRAGVYMRVSTANQEDEETIQNQDMELVARVEADGNSLLPDCIYKDEGWSGSILERPELDRMRADARDKKFDILYAYDRGRLSRIFIHQEVILGELREVGIEYLGLHDINGVSDEERLMGSVMGIFQEYERLKIAERMRIGKVRKVRENKKLLGYQPKYGYDYYPRIKKGPDARDGYFSINEKQASVVNDIYTWCGEEFLSKYAIRARLYKLGISPLKGKKKYWSTSVIDRMLRDTTYMGEHYYNKTESVATKNPRKVEKYRKTVKGSRIARPKEEWLMVEVPAIVTPELFEKVQTQLARNKKFSSRNNKNNKYLLGGVIYCTCGFARTGDPAKTSRYYRCTDRLNNGNGTRQCDEHGINVPVLDDLVWQNLGELLKQPELVFEQAKKWQNERVSPLQSELARLKERLQGLEDKHQRFLHLFGEGEITEHQYKEKKREITENTQTIISEIKSIEDEIANKPSLPLEELAEGVIKLVEDLDFAEKKEIVQKVVTKVVATKEEVSVWGRIPVLATEKVDINVKHSNSSVPTQSKNDSNQSGIVLDVKYRYRWPAKCRQINPL
jgi:site-specific DNA recombinase